MEKLIHKIYLSVLGILFVGLMATCNKEIANKLEIDDTTDALHVEPKRYKVLYVVMEGAVGNIIGTEATDFGKAPNMAKLLANGLFTWNAVSSDLTNDYSTFADLFSGVKRGKHQVTGENLSTSQWANTPSFIHYLQSTSNLNTAVVTSNDAVSNLLSAQGDDVQFLSSDEDVLAQSLSAVASDENDLVVATFNSIKLAGESDAYSPDSDTYMNAIGKLDGYLGQLLDALHDRKNYKSENWLVIVSSNTGGDYELPSYLNDGTIYSDMSRNNFIIVNNKSFSYRALDRPNVADPTYDGHAVTYTGAGGYAELGAGRANPYNFGKGVNTGEYTISLKLKVLKRHTSGNPIIIGKQVSAANFNAGWSITYNGVNGWRFISNGASGTQYSADAEVFDLDTWYVLTAKLYNDGGRRYAQVYRNGQPKGARVDVTERDYTSQDVSLQMGYKGGQFGTLGELSHIITDFRIWNTALSDDFIASNFCSTLALPTDLYYNSLIGYWPAIELGGEVRDYSPSRNHMELKGEYARTAFSERSTALCPTFPSELEALVIRNVDVPLFIYNWFSVNTGTDLNLDSQAWAPNYGNN